MAGTLTFNVGITYANGNLADRFGPVNFAFTQNVLGYDAPVVSIGTAAQAVSFPDLATEGWVFLYNLDPTNYVTYGPDSAGLVPFGRLNPGEFGLLRLSPGVALKMQAHTAACLVQIKAFND